MTKGGKIKFMGELGKENIPRSTAKIIEKEKPELSEAEEKTVNELLAIHDKYQKIPEEEMGVEKKLAVIRKEIPEIESDNGERILNAFVKEAAKNNKTEWLGIVISPAIEKMTEAHISKEKDTIEKGGSIKPLKIKLNLEGLKNPPRFVAARNPAGCELTVFGRAGDSFGYNAKGGVVKAEGMVGKDTARRMRGGEFYFWGGVGGFDHSAFGAERNNGSIYQLVKIGTGKEKQEKLVQIWPKGESEKQEK